MGSGTDVDEFLVTTHTANLPGIIFYSIYMVFILASVLYIAEVPLGRFGHYEEPVYTFLCGITLGLFPLALIMTFAPFKTPWREVAAFLYMVHTFVTGILLSFMESTTDRLLATGMLLADVIMVVSLLAGYESCMSIFLPYRQRREAAHNSNNNNNSGNNNTALAQP